MKAYWKISILSLVLFLGFVGLIYAKPTPAQTLFTQPTGQNIQMITNVNTPQLITALQQLQAQPASSSGNNNNPQTMAAGSLSQVVHRVSGNFNIGGTILLEVQAPLTMANLPYILAISFTGDYPGLDIPGAGHIPVNPPYPVLFFGLLDNSGHGFIPIAIPNDPGLLGLPFTSAVAVHDPLMTPKPFIISNPVSYTVGQGIVGTGCCTLGVLGGPGSECIAEGVSLNYCRLTTGGAVQNCVPTETTLDPAPTARVNLTLANLSSPAVNTIMQAVVASRISNLTYNATTFDCDDFADTLEQNLTGAGFNATYTYFIKYRGNTNVTDYAHAVTDVHLPDGSMFWIEPQTGQIISLDFDNDGRVGVNYESNPYRNGYHPTDDNAKISVYDNVGTATAAGAPRD
ncbi:hypothetical protein J4208_00950 [Candidatus Woesearchaeota archaeon]|nr:hypothetical protein [Candidatus Woesearchaeota archaeon]